MVMLSEACIPLYPPTLVYQQLISEPLSRINACPNEVTCQALSLSGSLCNDACALCLSTSC